MLSPRRTRSHFQVFTSVLLFVNKSIKKCDRESVDRRTDAQMHAQTDARKNDLVICNLLCYSYGTGNQEKFIDSASYIVRLMRPFCKSNPCFIRR